MAQPQTYTVRIDSATGRLDQRSLCYLLAAVEEYLDADMVDTNDDAARLAANVLWRHFGEGNVPNTSDEDWGQDAR